MSPPRNDTDSTGWQTAAGSQRTLLDLCTDAFILIFHIHAGNDPGQPENLRKEIALLVKDLDRQGSKHGHSEEDIKATRYALLALIDETILNSSWPFKDQWAERPLQLEYFGDHMAGERFFDLLERIRQKGSRKADLIEVFCIVLILGFQGKFKLRGREELNNLIRDIVGEVVNYRGGSPSLSPHWRIPEEPAERPPRTIPRWVWLAAASTVALVLITFVALKLWLAAAASDAASLMIL
jgi:type VI secretion system protein ImpK